jgi:hypothetical protein
MLTPHKWTVQDEAISQDRERYAYYQGFEKKLDDLLAKLSWKPRPNGARRLELVKASTLPETSAPPASRFAQIMQRILPGRENVRQEIWEVKFRPFALRYELYEGPYQWSYVRLIVPLMVIHLGERSRVDENTPGLQAIERE